MNTKQEKIINPSESFNVNKARNKLAKKYGLQFIDATHEGLPERFDLSQFVVDQEKRRDLEFAMNSLLKFLKLPIVTDAFGKDHDKRREMRTEIKLNYGPRYKELVDENKLRANNRGKVLLSLSYLAEDLNLQPQLEVLETRLRERFPNKFNDLDLENKKNMVSELEKIIVDFLKMVIEKFERDKVRT